MDVSCTKREVLRWAEQESGRREKNSMNTKLHGLAWKPDQRMECSIPPHPDHQGEWSWGGGRGEEFGNAEQVFFPPRRFWRGLSPHLLVWCKQTLGIETVSDREVEWHRSREGQRQTVWEKMKRELETRAISMVQYSMIVNSVTTVMGNAHNTSVTDLCGCCQCCLQIDMLRKWIWSRILSCFGNEHNSKSNVHSQCLKIQSHVCF